MKRTLRTRTNNKHS